MQTVEEKVFLSLLVLRTSDLHQAVNLFQALGLNFTLEKHGKGPEHYSSTFNGIVFELYPLVPGSATTTAIRLGFRVKSVDEILPPLRKLGAEVVSEIQETQWGRRAVIRDGDGHTIELLSTV